MANEDHGVSSSSVEEDAPEEDDNNELLSEILKTIGSGIRQSETPLGSYVEAVISALEEGDLEKTVKAMDQLTEKLKFVKHLVLHSIATVTDEFNP